MSLFLLLLYLVCEYTRPMDFFPELASFRMMLWLGAVCGVAALARVVFTSERPSLRTPQLSLMVALSGAIVASRVAQGWLGGGVVAFEDFGITAAVFLFIVMVVNTLARLRVVAFVVVASVAFLAAQSLIAYHLGDTSRRFTISQSVVSDDEAGPNSVSDDDDDEAEPVDSSDLRITRLRSVGFLADPNDFAQGLLMVLPILGLAWQSGRKFRNLLLVILPGAGLVYTVFLTRSRGALAGLAIILFIAVWQRWGTIRALSASAIPIAVILALNFTGGRSLSIHESSNAGRLEAWSAGLEMLRSNPLFGVGYGLFEDYHERTAHNSFVLCFAELGLVGYFFWLALLVVSGVQLSAILKRPVETEEDSDLRRWASAVRMSLYSFLGTALFLSRTYNVALYVILAFTVVLIECARKTEYSAKTPAIGVWALRTGAVEIASIGMIYGVVRMFHAYK